MSTKNIISAMLASLALLTVSVPAERIDEFEPRVSRRESELLGQLVSMAETNTVAAINFIVDEIAPDSSAALDFALGNLYFQEDQLRLAEESYLDAVEKLPLFKRALQNLARVQLLRDKDLSAIETLRPLLEKGQASADLYLLLGQAHLIGERYISAESAFRHKLLLRPNSREGMLGLAKALLEQQRYRESRAMVLEMLAADFRNQELWSLRANIAAALDDIDEAVTAIEGARRLESADPRLLAMLGDIYLNRQQAEDAVSAYTESFEQEDPTPDRILRAIEGFIALAAIAEAEEMMVKAESLMGDDESGKTYRIRLLQLRADLALIADNTDEAESLHRLILTEDPLSARSLLALARIEWKRGNWEEALLHCERAARIEGFEATALTVLAQIEVERGNYSEALRALKRAQALDPQDRVARYLEQVRRLADMQSDSSFQVQE